jgi:hypothetical protein
MHSFVLQDYTTIRGGTGASTITQGEAGWLDLSAYQDVIFYIDTREATGSPTIYFQTSPTKDESLFTAMVSGGTGLSAGTVTAVKALMSGATVPVARYVRWQIIGAPTWDATFRVLIAANSPGM